jgi:hypothetical protein
MKKAARRFVTRRAETTGEPSILPRDRVFPAAAIQGNCYAVSSDALTLAKRCSEKASSVQPSAFSFFSANAPPFLTSHLQPRKLIAES